MSSSPAASYASYASYASINFQIWKPDGEGNPELPDQVAAFLHAPLPRHLKKELGEIWKRITPTNKAILLGFLQKAAEEKFQRFPNPADESVRSCHLDAREDSKWAWKDRTKGSRYRAGLTCGTERWTQSPFGSP